jgi:glutathione peroxidase
MTTFYSTLVLTCFLAVIAASVSAEDSASNPLGFKMKSIAGQDVDLTDYKGKVILMVNVASKCGYTPQYEGLESMYEKYQDKGFVVLGFPCNQFLWQEPGSDAQIAEFCSKTYHVKFPMFSKIEVNGKNAAPLYQYLTALDTKPAKKGKISWNFEKFLIGKNGQVVARFAPGAEPDSKEIVSAIETELAKN